MTADDARVLLDPPDGPSDRPFEALDVLEERFGEVVEAEVLSAAADLLERDGTEWFPAAFEGDSERSPPDEGPETEDNEFDPVEPDDVLQALRSVDAHPEEKRAVAKALKAYEVWALEHDPDIGEALRDRDFATDLVLRRLAEARRTLLLGPRKGLADPAPDGERPGIGHNRPPPDEAEKRTEGWMSPLDEAALDQELVDMEAEVSKPEPRVATIGNGIRRLFDTVAEVRDVLRRRGGRQRWSGACRRAPRLGDHREPGWLPR